MVDGRRNLIVVILGPTASGKSNLAVDLALKFNGEVVSADSRQVYRGMDIGSGKITKKERKGVKHHLLDVASPKRKFTVAGYRRLAEKAISSVAHKGMVPFLCGGSAFYIESLIGELDIPNVAPDEKLRKKLSSKSAEELYKELKNLDPRRAANIDFRNTRRLIRAIEIIKKTGKPVQLSIRKSNRDFLILGVEKTRKEIDNLIRKRLDKRMKRGMVKEVKRLRESGLSWKKLESFGLEYRWIARYLQGKVSYTEMRERLLGDIRKFSRKQMTWWKNDSRIKWIKNQRQAEILIKIHFSERPRSFLRKRKSYDRG